MPISFSNPSPALSKIESPRSPHVLESGFNLIEVMVVLVILGFLAASVAPNIGGLGSNTRYVLRQISALSRQLHSQARLQGRVFRIAIEIPEDDKKPHRYWVESGSATTLLKTPEQREEFARKAEDRARGSDEKPTSEFHEDKSIFREKRELPKGLYFEDVEVRGESPQTTGTSYIHFFPQGIAQEAVIHLTDRKNLNYSLRVRPLTGDTQIVDSKKSLQDLHE